MNGIDADDEGKWIERFSSVGGFGLAVLLIHRFSSGASGREKLDAARELRIRIPAVQSIEPARCWGWNHE